MNSNPLSGPAKKNIDWWTFSAAVGVVAGFSLPMALFPGQAAVVVNSAYDTITNNMGVVYQWYGLAVFVFLIYLAFSRFGRVCLGPADSRPEYSTLSWIAMLFCAGIGAGLLYWAVIEWGYYIDSPPFGAEPRSTEAVEWAASYGLFHWGVLAWAFYCLPALGVIVKSGVQRGHQAATRSDSVTSIPSLNVTPVMTFAR